LAVSAARDTCQLFRIIIDRNDGALLARAPSLLPDPPRDPRWLMQYSRHPMKIKAMREFFGITHHWAEGSFGSTTYTKLLYMPGRCYMCGKRADGPPAWITTMVYLCSRRCRLELFRTKVVPIKPQYKYLPKSSLFMDRFIIPWLPIITMTKGRKSFAVLRRDLVKARKEYRRVILTAQTPEERQQRQAALFAVRMDHHIDGWMGKVQFKFKRNLKGNEELYVLAPFASGHRHINTQRRLRKFASKRDIPIQQAFSNRSVQHAITTCSRDASIITPSILSNAGLFRPESKHRMCSHCGSVIVQSRLDCHIATHHPDEFPWCRLNMTTGKAEYRCDLCDVSVRWFSEYALCEHQHDKYVYETSDPTSSHSASPAGTTCMLGKKSGKVS
ncbi:hypothetical protein HDZ31DRAFT_46618, partial [Schizophyllum fasciatum]